MRAGSEALNVNCHRLTEEPSRHLPNPATPIPPAPSFLKGVPRQVLQHVNVNFLLADALEEEGSSTWLGINVALSRMEATLEAARRQRRRITGAQRRLRGALAGRKSPTTPLGGIFSDVHFYVICWSRIAKLAGYVRDITGWRRVGLTVRRYRRDLDQMVEARDHLEHFEERLPGRMP